MTQEGHEVAEVVMNDRFHYGRLITQQWNTGKGFVLVEHDIIPWPGAIDDLLGCPAELCAHCYPNNGSWCTSLGCTKFSDELVRRTPVDPRWQNTPWDALDGAVFEALDIQPHIHTPPVAHAKATTLISRRGTL